MRFIKPAVCESELLCQPIAPCEILRDGCPGSMVINGTEYAVSILGYLPPAPAEPVVDGYRFTKRNGESHDLCLVRGRLECTCGDWLWRRSFQNAGPLADCKHCLACKRHLMAPRDQAPAPVYAASQFNDFDDP
ncbi:MAG TPA: hypothetical protein VN688_12420 [Gemmataceae bacterium]|nr:hypothetical protein [Gemmataceae bacterium]